ncbi:MAG: ATP-binding protein [Candidatus Magasanikbacteria bacterium]|jgi:nicotinamide riboside kinase|nr:ATP-binding protein [Candidatus Magasanikbacteria bacterium]
MKIAIIGTHSTGKTTLCKLLHAKLTLQQKEAYLMPEYVRMCPFPINEGTTLEAQQWILNQQMMQEGMYHTNDDKIIICDRATIDNFAYMHTAFADSEHDIAPHEADAVRFMQTYDYVFKTHRLPIAAKADGIRTTNEAFRETIDTNLQKLLQKHSIATVPLQKTIDYDIHLKDILALISA